MLKLFVCLLVVLPATVAWMTEYDKPFLKECPSKQSVYWIKSQHSNSREDRVWDYRCRHSSKISTTSEINPYDGTILFQCPRKGALVGVQSYHSNHHEDRIWSFKCCDVHLTRGANCLFTKSFVNQYDAVMDYKITPANNYLTGVYSEHNNHREDRVWRFETCSIVH
ncbi:hypothetical protein LOTGIDRAFT_133595 [Lottia gigantea]|uniref:Dermatopontin n=1 Tax=Lottia gigantea TaxID=225164 RepID=V3YYZ4_LOTGI|nr:hypothetical protein LOTGIDRAFT_133595 [Lottia gigantea]ESO83343.1 hypothetical protein LOTGIDRAFT_133595 [Lottia gigantea]